MAIEYYVKQRLNGAWKVVETCKTSEQAVRQRKMFIDQNPDKDFIVSYSDDALDAYIKRQSA